MHRLCNGHALSKHCQCTGHAQEEYRMKLSARARYAVRLLLVLAEHAEHTDIVNTTTLSAHTGVSVQFIEQIIRPLKQEGMVVSTRGVMGGHALGREAASITLGDVVRAIEGPIDLIPCCDDSVAQECPRHENCPTRPAWLHISRVLEREMDAITLADLLTSPVSLPDRHATPPMGRARNTSRHLSLVPRYD